MLYSYTGFNGIDSISLIFRKGMPVTVGEDHPKFEEINNLRINGELKTATDDEVMSILTQKTVNAWVEKSMSEGEYQLTPYGLYDSDGLVSSDLADKLAKALGEDPDNEPRIRAMVRFLARAKENPSMPDADKLYRWIFSEKLTLTPDGHFLGYKSVAKSPKDVLSKVEITLPNGDAETADYAHTMHDGDVYWSHFSGGGITNGVEFPEQVPQWVGAVVEMPRDKVDSRGDVECSVGLHVGTYGYASKFYAGDISQLLLVKVDPKDVVSVPDYDFTKLRACRYTVVGEIEDILDVDLWVDDHFAPEIELESVDKNQDNDIDFMTEAVIAEIMKRIKENS